MSTKELTRENSAEQAKILMQIKFLVATMDLEYLEQVKKDWSKALSFRESAVILASNVDAAMVKNESDRLLIQQLGTLIEFAKREQEIAELKNKHDQAELQRRAVDRMFGL